MTKSDKALVINSTIDHNLAQGGGGGNGVGGGIANLLSATTTVDSSSLTNNQANVDGGGARLGGGDYNDATSSLALTASRVTGNHANGSSGIGGVYNLGTFTFDVFTVIKKNHASRISACVRLDTSFCSLLLSSARPHRATCSTASGAP
jgi:hypothetical protein